MPNLTITYVWDEGFTNEVTYPDIPRGYIKRGMRPIRCELSRPPENHEENKWISRCLLNLMPKPQSYKEAFEESERKAIKIMELRANFYNDDGGMLQATYNTDSDIRYNKQIMNFLPITVGFNRDAITDEEKEWCKKCETMCKENEPIEVKMPASNKVLPEIRAGKVQIPNKTEKSKAKSDKLGLGLILIPMYSIYRIGKIFIEGLRYGRDNWKKGVFDTDYQEERLEHAFNHLMLYKEGDTSEDHLAKVAWFCVTQMELERMEKEGLKNDNGNNCNHQNEI